MDLIQAALINITQTQEKIEFFDISDASIVFAFSSDRIFEITLFPSSHKNECYQFSLRIHPTFLKNKELKALKVNVSGIFIQTRKLMRIWRFAF